MNLQAGWGPALGFLIALGLGLLLMPVTVAVGRKFGFVVRPRLYKRGPRRLVSYLGGVAVAASVLIGFSLLGEASDSLYFLIGGLALLILGIVDDRSGGKVPVFLRFLVQVGVACWVALYLYEGSAATVLFEIFVIVAVTNAFNLLDNMDGVAGCTALATASSVSVLAVMGGRPNVAITAACLAGASLAFLRLNFRSVSSYLGNGGSLFIGFLISALAVNTSVRLGTGWELVAVVLILAVPTTDMFVVTISRFIHRRSFVQGGTDHLSHRLVRLGLTTQMAAVIHGLAALFAGGLVLLAFRLSTPRLLVAGIALFAVLGFLLLTVKVYRTPGSTVRRLVAVITGALVACILLAVAPVLSAASDLHASRSHFAKGVEQLMAFNPREAAREFTSAGESAREAEQALGSFLTFPARTLPIAGPNVRLARDLAESADLLTPAALDGVEALSAFPTDEQGRPIVGVENGRVRFEGWIKAKDYFARAASVVKIALIRAENEKGFIFPPLSSARHEFVTRGGELLQALEGASGLADIMPLIAGADGQRTWFLAIQNPVELRATGGFLGAFGILKAEAGQIHLESLDSNVALPPLERPVGDITASTAHYDRFASRSMWQNVNMTPDFPTAAEQMMAMWDAQTGKKVDGVIAVDATGLSSILKIVGPVESKDLGRIDSENFARVTLNEAYSRFPERAERADFLLAVGREAWSRLLTGSYKNPLQLKPLAEAVAGRHVLAWSPLHSSAFTNLKASGELKAPSKDSDFLLVVGQNAAANKMDYYMRREIAYEVRVLKGGRSTATLQVQLANTAPKSGLAKYVAGPLRPTDPAGLNRTYISIFTSSSRGLLSSTINGDTSGVESHVEKGLAAFSNFLEAAPGSSGTFALSLSQISHRQGEYRLYVQKQPTLTPDRFNLEVVLPQGAFPTGATPGMKIDGIRVRWSGVLDTDKQFVVRYGDTLGDRLRNLFGPDSNLAMSLSTLSR